VLIPAVRRFKAAATGSAGGYKFSPAERLHLAVSTAAPLLLIAALGSGISEARDYLLNKSRWDQQNIETRAMTDLDRAGMFGSASPIINTLYYAYLQKYASGSSSSLLTGPQYGAIAQDVDALRNYFTSNSDRTANAEKNALAAIYDIGTAAVINPALAGLAESGDPRAMIAAFTVLQAINSSEAKRQFSTKAAEKLTGQKVIQRSTPGSHKGKKSPLDL
jgi:hypothetical protein